MKTYRFLLSLLIISVIFPIKKAYALPTSSSIEVLVNRTHPLAATYRPDDLVQPSVLTIQLSNEDNMKLRAEASQELENMFAAAQADIGSTLVLSSGYRSYAEQSELYHTAHAGTMHSSTESVAPPGASEHQTGLAADIILVSYFCAAQPCFIMTRDYGWLLANSYKYGFIIRYPANSQASTGYGFEPWHYRYVGKYLANQLHTNGQTLEQYYTDTHRR